MTHLFLCQIGPVQSFIAAGRRTQDLAAGSIMLSELAKSGLNAIQDNSSFKPIFPMWNTQEKFPQGVPHRFAFLCDANPQATAEKIEKAIRERWVNEYAKEVFDILSKKSDTNDWKRIFETQLDDWLEFYWVAVPYTDHNTSFDAVNHAMAQRRFLRNFPHIEAEGVKCSLTGAQSALPLKWINLIDLTGKDENERLGTTAIIKRLWGRKLERIPSTTDIAGKLSNGQYGYLAVLHMDGDRMGERLGNLKTLTEHQQFSQKLAHFADETVPQIIGRYERAQLIYAGGDDVLALLPLRYALDCAYELRLAFEHDTSCKMSAGIAITPHDFPLDLALNMARQAEAEAKEGYGRDAIVVTEAHGTGTIREAGGSWQIVNLMNTLIDYFANDTLSGKLGYDMLEIDKYMWGDKLKEARQLELERIIKRRLAEKMNKEEKEALAQELARRIAEFAEVKKENGDLRWGDMAHWVILARFIAKPTKEKAGA